MRTKHFIPLFIFAVFAVFIVLNINPDPVQASSKTYSWYCPDGGTLETRDGTHPTNGLPSVVLSCTSGAIFEEAPASDPETYNVYAVETTCPGGSDSPPARTIANSNEVHKYCPFNEPPTRPTITVTQTDPGDPDPEIGPADDPLREPDCDAGSGFTWIVCGIINFIIDVVEFIQNKIIIPFLEVSPLQVEDDSGETTAQFEIWRNVRTLANVLLVPIFLILIFAQAFSLNIEAYTIKKALPKLAIAAVLIQFSFYIVALMVDVTNIVGNGIGQLLTAPLRNENVGFNFGSSGTGGFVFFSGLSVAGIATVVGVTTAIAGGAFFTLIGILLAVLLVFLTLIFRQILIVALGLFAPVAFVAWILPGTDKLAKTWWNLLSRALMMYPLIVILFAAGSIVATIASTTVAGDGSSETEEALGTIIGLAAIIGPLAMIPLTFKLAGAALAGIGALLQKGRGLAMGGRDGKGGISRLRERDARRRREAKGGELFDKSGRFQPLRRFGNKAIQAGTNPFAYIRPTRKGRQTSRAQAATGMVGASNEAAKQLQEDGFTDVDALRHLVQNGGGKRSIERGAADFRRRGMFNAADQLEQFGGKYAGSVEHRAGALLLLASQGKADDEHFKSLDDFVSNSAVKSAVLAQGLTASGRAGRKEHSRVVSGLDRNGNVSMLSDKLVQENGEFTGEIAQEFRGTNVEAEIQNLILESGPQQFSQMDPKTIRAIAPVMARLAAQDEVRAYPQHRDHEDRDVAGTRENREWETTVPRERLIEQIATLTHSSAYNNPRSKRDIDAALDRFHVQMPEQTVRTPAVQPDFIPDTRVRPAGGAGGAAPGAGGGGAGPSGGQTGPATGQGVPESRVMVRDTNTGAERESPHYIDTTRLENAIKQSDKTLADRISGETIRDSEGHPVTGPVMIQNPNAGAQIVNAQGQQRIDVETHPARTVPLRQIVQEAQGRVRPGDFTQGRGTFEPPDQPPQDFGGGGDQGGGP